MSDLHDERIRELEQIIMDAPMIVWRYETGNWPGTDEPLMPLGDRETANRWLDVVYRERKKIERRRSPEEPQKAT